MGNRTVQPANTNRPDEKQIAEWKKKYGKVMQITIPEDDKILILREPGIKELELAASAKQKPGALPFDFNRSILSSCKLYEDEGFFSDDKRAMTAFTHLDKFNVVKESKLEEL